MGRGRGRGRKARLDFLFYLISDYKNKSEGRRHTLYANGSAWAWQCLISGIVEIINKGEGGVKKGETGETGERREGAESVTSGCRVWHTYFTKVPNRKHRRRHFVKFIAKWPPCECQLPTPSPPSFPSPALSATAGQAICAVLFLHFASDMLAVASRLKCPLKCRSQFRPRAALTFDTLIATAREGGREGRRRVHSK